MSLIIKKNEFFFLILFIINLGIAFITPYILPERYFYDTKLLINDTYNEIGWIGSYPFSIMFYKITGLRYLPLFFIALIQIPIINYLLYKIGIPSNFHKLNAKNILIYIALMLVALFISMPSKEFITSMMVSTIPFIYQSKKSVKFKIIASLIIISCFSIFRLYYIIIPLLAIGMYILTFVKFKKKVFSILFYGLMLTSFISISHGIIKGEYISKTTREDYVTGKNNNYKVNSAIKSPISQETWYGEGIGIYYGFLAVNIPIIEGFKNALSPQVIAFVIWQLFVFYILIVQFNRCLKNKKQNQLKIWSLLILFSYFMIQGIFEPDLGTSVRHKIGFLPLIYFVFYYENLKNKP